MTNIEFDSWKKTKWKKVKSQLEFSKRKKFIYIGNILMTYKNTCIITVLSFVFVFEKQMAHRLVNFRIQMKMIFFGHSSEMVWRKNGRKIWPNAGFEPCTLCYQSRCPKPIRLEETFSLRPRLRMGTVQILIGNSFRLFRVSINNLIFSLMSLSMRL